MQCVRKHSCRRNKHHPWACLLFDLLWSPILEGVQFGYGRQFHTGYITYTFRYVDIYRWQISFSRANWWFTIRLPCSEYIYNWNEPQVSVNNRSTDVWNYNVKCIVIQFNNRRVQFILSCVMIAKINQILFITRSSSLCVRQLCALRKNNAKKCSASTLCPV